MLSAKSVLWTEEALGEKKEEEESIKVKVAFLDRSKNPANERRGQQTFRRRGRKGKLIKRMIGNDLPFHLDGISKRFPLKWNVRLSSDKDQWRIILSVHFPVENWIYSIAKFGNNKNSILDQMEVIGKGFWGKRNSFKSDLCGGVLLVLPFLLDKVRNLANNSRANCSYKIDINSPLHFNLSFLFYYIVGVGSGNPLLPTWSW